MSTRAITICFLGILAVIGIAALGLSHQLMERTFSAPVQYTERSRCEYSPAGQVLESLEEHDRVPYESCDLATCVEIEATLAPTARRLHDLSSVEDC